MANSRLRNPLINGHRLGVEKIHGDPHGIPFSSHHHNVDIFGHHERTLHRPHLIREPFAQILLGLEAFLLLKALGREGIHDKCKGWEHGMVPLHHLYHAFGRAHAQVVYIPAPEKAYRALLGLEALLHMERFPDA